MRKLIFLALLLCATHLMAQNAKVQYDDQGRAIASQHDVFDNHDRLAVSIIYDYTDSGIVDTRTLIAYDRQGRAYKKEIYSADEYLLFSEITAYDRQGRKSKIAQISYDENGLPHKTVIRYRYSQDGAPTITINGHQLAE